MAALAEHPYRVRNIFIERKRNEWGLFGVNFYKNGTKHEVIVDDHIPTKDDEPCFSWTKGNELWVVILEKAWAKVNGDYCKIIGGQSHETFRDITGAPAYYYDTKDT